MAEAEPLSTTVLRAAKKGTARLAILTALVAVADFAFGAVYVDVLLRAGLSSLHIGVGFFAAFVVSTCVEVPSGDWGDRWGQRRLAVLGLLLWGVSLLAFALFQGLPALLLCTLVLWSVGQAFFSGAPVSLIINEIPVSAPDLRSHAIRFSSVSKWVGSASGALLVLLGLMRVSAPALIGLAGALLILLALWLRFGWAEAQRFEPSEASRGLWERLRPGWVKALSPLLVLTGLTSALLSVLLMAWQPLVSEVLDLPVSLNGATLLVMTVFAALGAWLTRFRKSGRWGTKDVVLALVITGAALLFVGLLPSAFSAILAILVTELLLSYCMTTLAIQAHGLFEDQYRNLLWSVFSALMGASMAVADLLFGWLWNLGSLTVGLAVAGAVGVVFALAVGVLWRPEHHRLGGQLDR